MKDKISAFKVLILDDEPENIIGVLGDLFDYLGVESSSLSSFANPIKIESDNFISQILGREIRIYIFLNVNSNKDNINVPFSIIIEPDKVIDIINKEFAESFDLVLIDDHWGNGKEFAGQEIIFPEAFKKIKGSYPGLPLIALFTRHYTDYNRIIKFYQELKNKGIQSDRILTPCPKDPYQLFNLFVWSIRYKILNFELLQAKETKKFLANIQLRYNPKDYGLLGCSGHIENVFKIIQLFAESNNAILITGESGTGKTTIAKVIHELSKRKDGPFISFNCANIQEDKLENELFGVEPKQFTGVKGRPGLFEMADKGTIFLDEITEMSPFLQAKLLKVVEEKEFRRVGGTKTIKVDVRIIAGTNKNIEDLVQKGEFRKDLYYRLNVLRLDIKPLRERREDILELIDFFIKKKTEETNKRIELSNQAIEFLTKEFYYSGNVRELETIITRIWSIFSDGSTVTRECLIDMVNDLMKLQKKHVSLTVQTEKEKTPTEKEDVEEYKYSDIQDILNKLEDACKKAIEQKFSEDTKEYWLTYEEWAECYYNEKQKKQGVSAQYIHNIFKNYAGKILQLLKKQPDKWPCLTKLKIMNKRSKTLMDLKEFCKKKLDS